MRIFLDTNIWVDIVMQRQPFYADSASAVSYANRSGIEVYTSSLTVVNAHYICCVRGKMPFDRFKAKTTALLNSVKICSVNSEDILLSFMREWFDFEDSVQHCAAIRCGADYIVTRNAKDFAHSLVQVIGPKDLIEI